jgi:hypothetical protein
MHERASLLSDSMSIGTHLRSVVYRMLGALSEVDDAVQQARQCLDRADTGRGENLSAP